jgi:uncharacterized membrane protein YhaH (DUF805 family)
MLYAIFFAFDFTSYLNPIAGLTTFVFASFGMVAPVQGGIGAWHFMAIEALSLYGVTYENGVIFAFVAHASSTVMIILVGLISMMILPFINRRNISEIISNQANDEYNEKVEVLANHSINLTESLQPRKHGMFSKPFSFDGRIRRTEYGISSIIFAFLHVILTGLIHEGELTLLWFAYIPLYWFIFAQGAKRCHDLGESGWFQIIPLYPIWMIFDKGEQGTQNKYGINPKC